MRSVSSSSNFTANLIGSAVSSSEDVTVIEEATASDPTPTRGCEVTVPRPRMRTGVDARPRSRTKPIVIVSKIRIEANRTRELHGNNDEDDNEHQLIRITTVCDNLGDPCAGNIRTNLRICQ